MNTLEQQCHECTECQEKPRIVGLNTYPGGYKLSHWHGAQQVVGRVFSDSWEAVYTWNNSSYTNGGDK